MCSRSTVRLGKRSDSGARHVHVWVPQARAAPHVSPTPPTQPTLLPVAASAAAAASAQQLPPSEQAASTQLLPHRQQHLPASCARLASVMSRVVVRPSTRARAAEQTWREKRRGPGSGDRGPIDIRASPRTRYTNACVCECVPTCRIGRTLHGGSRATASSTPWGRSSRQRGGGSYASPAVAATGGSLLLLPVAACMPCVLPPCAS
jgi:hypothetical protein